MAEEPQGATKVDTSAASPAGTEKAAGSEEAGGGTNQDPPAGGKEGASAEGTKTKEPEKPARVVPEKYDLKLPEGSQLDEGAVERVSSHAKENKLTNEEAQARLDHEGEVVKTYVAGAEAQLKQQTEAWLEDVKKDSELGGDNFKASCELAKRVVDRFAPDTLKDGLNKTGFGNHPGLIKMLVDIGRSMSEDKLVMPGAQTPKSQKSLEDHLYGDTSAQEK